MPRFQITFSPKTPLRIDTRATDLGEIFHEVVDNPLQTEWEIIERITVDLSDKVIEAMRRAVSSDPLAALHDKPLKVVGLFLKMKNPYPADLKDPEVVIVPEPLPPADLDGEEYLRATAGHDHALHDS